MPYIMLSIDPEDADIDTSITRILNIGATLTAGYIPYMNIRNDATYKMFEIYRFEL